jgi:hypothetical protein
MQIEIKIEKTIIRKKGYPIIISIFINKNDKLYPTTGYYAFPHQWDETKVEPTKNHPYYHGVYEYILQLKTKINKILERKQQLTALQIKNLLMGKNPESLTAFWENFIKELKQNGKGGNARYHSSNLLAFKKYKKDVLFSEINYDFIVKYRDFNLNKKDKDGNNTISNNGAIVYIRGVRTVYNEAKKRKLYIPEDVSNPFEGVMPKPTPTKDKYFSIEEMKKINNAEKKHKYYDFFILCFLLGGIDYVDIKNLKYDHVKNNRVKFERFKGGTSEIIDNFIFPEAQIILDKYKDDSGYLVPLHLLEKDTYSFRDNYVRRFRPWLKKIEVESYFTSKTPRYTFIDIGKQLFLNRDIIMELTGHSHGDVHSIYEGKFPNHIKDEAHLNIISSVFDQEVF